MLLNSTIFNFRPRTRGKVQLHFMLQHPSWVDILGARSHRRGRAHRRLDAFAYSSFCRSTTGELSRRGACGKQSVGNFAKLCGLHCPTQEACNCNKSDDPWMLAVRSDWSGRSTRRRLEARRRSCSTTCGAENITFQGRRMRDYHASASISSIVGHAQICQNAML